MKKITRYVNDVDLNTVASLASQLDSYKDDSGFGIYAISISEQEIRVQLDTDLFIAKFCDFIVHTKRNQGSEYPYEFRARINGVVFFTILKNSVFKDLENTIPEQQWQRIQKSVQNSQGGESNENQR